MSNIEKMLNDELEKLTPPMSQRLKSHPITPKQPRQFNFRFKLITPLIAVLVLLLLLLPFALDNQKPSGYVYMLEVNPTLIITTDKKHIVTAVKSGNKDADQVLIGLEDENLVGKDFKTASEIIADELLQLGYFQADAINAFQITSDDKTDIAHYFTDYFSEKGYMSVGVFKTFDLKTFNEKFACELKDVAEVHQYVEKMQEYYLANINQDFASLYQSEYLTTYLKELVEKEVVYITEVYDILSEINNTYYAILTCDDLPVFYRDYFVAREYYEEHPDEMTGNIKELFKKMQESLNRYYELTGNSLDNTSELFDLIKTITLIPVTIIGEYIDNLANYFSENNREKINELFTVLTNLFPNLADDLNNLKNIPTTVEEFIIKTKSICQAVNNDMKKAYKKIYDMPKEAISAALYQQKINEIMQKYGNLENFYNSLQ